MKYVHLFNGPVDLFHSFCMNLNNICKKKSVAFHEGGRRHKANVEKRLLEISRQKAKDDKLQHQYNEDIKRMEDAAVKAYMTDISSNADITSRSINRTFEDRRAAASAAAAAASKNPRNIDPMLPHVDPNYEPDVRPEQLAAAAAAAKKTPKESLWCEAASPDGHTYYWNVKTNETVWVKPKEGFMKLAEYNRINELAIEQQEATFKKDADYVRENADEIAAKFKREQYKQFKAKREAAAAAKEAEEEPEDSIEAKFRLVPEEPMGKWQPVVEKIVPQIDLQLPKLESTWENYAATVPYEPEPPVRVFKEKTVTLTEDLAGVSGTFKKRKILGGNKKNARQRLDDD